ncbi:MAG: Na+ dependent nucleoside transporter domain protein [Gemmataceae bacterium]|nr:Na+ dependent nucleoside transporter domain protein [Gemmataceae bacterium]
MKNESANPYSGTPLPLRGLCLVICAAAVAAVYTLPDSLGPRVRAGCGIVFFISLVAAFSSDLRRVNLRTFVAGFVLQLLLAFLVLWGEWTINGVHYSVYNAIDRVGHVVTKFIDCSDRGAEFVFGNLARPGDIALNPGKEFLFMFAFKALPPILFVSAFFTVLYYFGVLQFIVRIMAKVMMVVMGTSGAETLSVAANVFMGQTEAPLIVKPYVPRMTKSELFTLMVSGMAHISGGMMVVYINYGANPTAVITTCIMACPCSLYIAKLMLPEITRPETLGSTPTDTGDVKYVNAIDAAASGTGDGLKLALNVAAMLIVFVAFVALFDMMLGGIKPTLVSFHLMSEDAMPWLDGLTLRKIFGWMFSPVAALMGVDWVDTEKVGSLLGAKLSVNEHFAFLDAKVNGLFDKLDPVTKEVLTPGKLLPRSQQLAAFALTGFANFASIGIQIGGIGAMAPERRGDLAKLGMKALFAGFTATLINASLAGILMK